MERYFLGPSEEHRLATLFFSYSHKDATLRDQLETQLAMLKRQGVIQIWHDRRIVAGEELDHAISAHIETDDVILLLVSPDFLASNYCYEVEMVRAMERHRTGEAIVIPVILRACDWQYAPFGKLLATPTDGRPVMQWPDRDQAFLEVAKSVRAAVQKLNETAANRPNIAQSFPSSAPTLTPLVDGAPRSSNLALTKHITDREKDQFLHDAFEYMVSFFENSLTELGERNPGIEGSFRRVDANRFFGAAYRDGKAVARCTIFIGGMFGRGINFFHGETTESNNCNESVTVDADDQSCFLRPMMSYGRQSEPKLTFEGAAEHFWAAFIRPLQSR
jgi:hypothetical protein